MGNLFSSQFPPRQDEETKTIKITNCPIILKSFKIFNQKLLNNLVSELDELVERANNNEDRRQMMNALINMVYKEAVREGLGLDEMYSASTAAQLNAECDLGHLMVWDTLRLIHENAMVNLGSIPADKWMPTVVNCNNEEGGSVPSLLCRNLILPPLSGVDLNAKATNPEHPWFHPIPVSQIGCLFSKKVGNYRSGVGLSSNVFAKYAYDSFQSARDWCLRYNKTDSIIDNTAWAIVVMSTLPTSECISGGLKSWRQLVNHANRGYYFKDFVNIFNVMDQFSKEPVENSFVMVLPHPFDKKFMCGIIWLPVDVVVEVVETKRDDLVRDDIPLAVDSIAAVGTTQDTGSITISTIQNTMTDIEYKSYT